MQEGSHACVSSGRALAMFPGLASSFSLRFRALLALFATGTADGLFGSFVRGERCRLSRLGQTPRRAVGGKEGGWRWRFTARFSRTRFLSLVLSLVLSGGVVGRSNIDAFRAEVPMGDTIAEDDDGVGGDRGGADGVVLRTSVGESVSTSVGGKTGGTSRFSREFGNALRSTT